MERRVWLAGPGTTRLDPEHRTGSVPDHPSSMKRPRLTSTTWEASGLGLQTGHQVCPLHLGVRGAIELARFSLQFWMLWVLCFLGWMNNSQHSHCPCNTGLCERCCFIWQTLPSCLSSLPLSLGALLPFCYFFFWSHSIDSICPLPLYDCVIGRN